ncbi:MAG: type II secretion system F family protein [Candidatus Hydrothermarchaeaceae archaeon]
MWYERACKIAGKYFYWIPGELVKDDVESYKKFTGLSVKKEDADALAKGASLLSAVPLFILTGVFAARGLSWLPWLYLIILVPLVIFLYLRNYPKYYASVYRTKVTGAMPEMINNMALALKVKPNLENALGYTAERTTDPVGEEMRKLVWGIYMREYVSADEALEKFAGDWRYWNKDFSTAVHYLRGSMLEKREDKRISMIDKGMDVVLNGVSMRMMKYASSLEMPTTMLYFAGVLLPLILIALLPTLSYVGVSIGFLGIFLAYCILLPLLVYFWTRRILDKRPVASSAPLIPDEHPGFPPKGRILFMGKALPVLIIPFLGLGLAVPGLVNLGWEIPLLDKTILVLWGFTIGLSTYLWFTTKHKAKMRDGIRELEEDFAEALHHLENRVAESRPLEDAFAHVGSLMIDKKIGRLFAEISTATITERKPLRSILFDEEGPLRFIHTDLIRSCLSIVVESSRKSNDAAAIILSRITAHLDNMTRVEAKIKEKLGSTVETMQATMIYFAPFIAGVVVVLQDLMNKQLAKGRWMAGVTSFDPGSVQSYFNMDITGAPGLAGLLQGTATPLSMGVLQVILGVYMLEMIAILTFYIEEIRNGDDAVVKRMSLSKNLVTGMIIFTASIILAKFFLSMVA